MTKQTVREQARDQGFRRQDGSLYYMDIVERSGVKKKDGKVINLMRRIYRFTSKYMPHQGEREKARRRRNAEKSAAESSLS